MNRYLQASNKLYRHIYDNHWDGGKVSGPDPGLRLNFRVWRFVKNYLPAINWKDSYYLLQCQGYWIMNNWKLHELNHESSYREAACNASEYIMERQTKKGYWEYPLPQWKDRIATVEGIYASLGLLYSYRHTRKQEYLDAALKWYGFLLKEIGFETYKDGIAVNYFAHHSGNLVPNNSTLLLTFLSELFELTKSAEYLQQAPQLVKFIQYAQKETGELPYIFLTSNQQSKPHFLCYQYNSFQFLDLSRYFEITEDPEVYKVLKGIVQFLETGVYENRQSRYNCDKAYPEVNYYTAVMAAAFLKAGQIGLGDFSKYEENLYNHVLAKQNSNGGFPFSHRNYRVLNDGRSYPRYLNMILKHLLMKAQ